jgi:hypothetical protein
MESEKVIYWMTLGVLVLATTTGFVTKHRGWGDRLAEHSIALLSQASEMATNYAGIAGEVLGRGESDLALPPRMVVDVQNDVQDVDVLSADVLNADVLNKVETRLACVQRTLAHRQAEMDRLRAIRFRVRGLERVPRTMVWPDRNLVIEVPQEPPTPDDTF